MQVVYVHKGYEICFDKNPSYVINDKEFEGKSYNLVQDAIDAIDKAGEKK